MKKTIIPALICLAIAGITSATVVVRKTVTEYCDACSDLKGFPGVLQRVGFIPHGGCHPIEWPHKGEGKGQPPPPKNFKCSKEPCDIRGRRGRCVPRVNREHTQLSCACEPIHISK